MDWQLYRLFNDIWILWKLPNIVQNILCIKINQIKYHLIIKLQFQLNERWREKLVVR